MQAKNERKDNRYDFVPDFSVEDLAALPMLAWDQLTHEWTSDYYDGPMAGMCSYEGVRYWFSCIEIEDDNTRVYALLALTGDQLALEDYWHSEFVKHVKERPNDGIEAYRRNFYDRYQAVPFPPCSKEQARYRVRW